MNLPFKRAGFLYNSPKPYAGIKFSSHAIHCVYYKRILPYKTFNFTLVPVYVSLGILEILFYICSGIPFTIAPFTMNLLKAARRHIQLYV